MHSLRNHKILLGVTGGIAAYKTPALVRLLVKAGAEVQVLMTPAAHRFVTAETLSVVSGKPVYTDFFEDDKGTWNNHVHLGLWADMMLIAPATANTLAKLGAGIADNLLLTTLLSARCPVWVAPAMDLDMYIHPSFIANIELLKSRGVQVIPAETGALASGLHGEGRMAEPETIAGEIASHFGKNPLFAGKKVLVTAGPTYENLDPVRFIGNYSSGKMGFALARAFYEFGAEVTLVTGPVHLNEPAGVQCVHVQSAEEMLNACLQFAQESDIVVMAAAVADYRPAEVATEKMKKNGDELQITLTRNPDILQTLCNQKRAGQFIIGFALETQNALDYALGKMKNKNLDMIVLNSLRDTGAGFGHDTNKVTLLTPDGKAQELPLQSKDAVADKIAGAISDLVQTNYI
ncbi:MAG: bifunctional phosphopantothenoylcysteine decarboxylase/phosphopantothenate--cysteine ligase CoaBC [Bacteroidetes bacterium]|nr:bifunctional phosphopantothenoylcysteine decarboxylase/phosphopantothenate--cysteine ligase CoaBC [Bacteroidota bacterium]